MIGTARYASVNNH